MPGGWLNKAVVETAGYLYSRHCGQKFSSGTRPQGFPEKRTRDWRQCHPCEAPRARWDSGGTEFVGRPPQAHLYEVVVPHGRRHGLCWHEAKALTGTRQRALSEPVRCTIMRVRGHGAKRTRPFEARLDEGVAVKARQPMQVHQDAPLLFPDDNTSSFRRGHTVILSNKQSRTTIFISNDYLMIVNCCLLLISVH